MREKIEILYGDICKIEVDAIICETNTNMEPDSEITDRLVRQGGDDVQIEYNRIANVQKGNAVATTAGKLPAKLLISTIMSNPGEDAEEEEEMMVAVRNSLHLAKEKKLKTVSMPLIGARSSIPIKRAAELILAEIKRHLEWETTLEKVFVVLDEDAAYEAFEEAYRQL